MALCELLAGAKAHVVVFNPPCEHYDLRGLQCLHW